MTAIKLSINSNMIVDTFLFNDEFDMLDIRLALSKSYVDRWVVCEANRTLSGQIKPYNLTQNLDNYSEFANKLVVLQLDVPETWSNWDIENGQRAYLVNGYEDCNDHTVIIHSDLDEILNPVLWPEILTYLDQIQQPLTCILDMYVYKFDQQVGRKWNGNVIAKKGWFADPCKLYKGLDSGVGTAKKKKNRSHCRAFPKTAGWHWTWIGDDQRIKNKVKSCIESQHRDSQQVLDSFKKLDPASAINHKATTALVNPDYPDQVMKVLYQYPFWT